MTCVSLKKTTFGDNIQWVLPKTKEYEEKKNKQKKENIRETLENQTNKGEGGTNTKLNQLLQGVE